MRASGAEASPARCSRGRRTPRPPPGYSGVSLDTGLHNDAARALYAAAGYEEREVRRAPTRALAAAVGGPGFVSYVKRV